MGLAASQARLLTITARKSDCEFMSMSLSHQKIALARDMERISEDYQKALNKTKLVYDYYGSGLSQMNLDYNLLMSPSVYNDYYPKLITDNKNRIVLDARYAAAARAAGVPPEGYLGTPSSVIRNKFIEALADSAVINTATAAAIKSVTYNNGVGLGVEYNATLVTKDISYNELLEQIKTSCQDMKDYGLVISATTNDTERDKSKQNNDYPNLMLLSRDGNDSDPAAENLCLWYDYTQNSKLYNLTLYQLLTDEKQYTYYTETVKCANYPIGEAAFMQQILVGNENSKSFLNWMTDQFSTVLGGVALNDQALQYAYNQVYDLLYPNENVQNYLGKVAIEHNWGNMDHDDAEDFTDDYWDRRKYLEEIGTRVDGFYSSTDTVVRSSGAYIGMVYSSNASSHRHDGGNRKDMAVSLTNLAKVFLTAFKEYLDGIDNSVYSYELGQTTDGRDGTSRCSLYDPREDDQFKIAVGTDVDTGNTSVMASFYDTLFNMICMYGWSENDKIATDSSYMQEMLKNGSVYISSISNDGQFYQTSYDCDTYIAEVTDMDGVAQAEAKYNAEKAKIESKENRIDVKMKNLDTEISSLTTEYDSVKSIISKSVEKSFKRYDA